MATILDGRVIRDRIREALKGKIARLSRPPALAIIQVGAREDSSAYIRQKQMFGESVGARVALKQFPEAVPEGEVLSYIEALNEDESTDGIILQIPLPAHLSKDALIEAIAPQKDVDGLTSKNAKCLWAGSPRIIPATARGILTLLRAYDIDPKGKRVVVVGRSTLVGKPTALLLLSEHATVTIAHRETRNLPLITKEADILVAAVGCPYLIGKEHVSSGQTVIDVGINTPTGEKLDEEISEKKLVGDVDFDAVKDIVAAISPVPGGVGPMTVASLFENLVEAAER